MERPTRTQPARRGRAGKLEDARDDARDCTRCDLYKHATQTVFGDGPARARLMFVGEQPGDEEDKTGTPFVGPAGRLLRAAFAEAGIDEQDVYITNAVKHFKFEERGKRRIHKRPNTAEINACRFWLEVEIGAVQPEILVALGATAAASILGKGVSVLRDRGKLLPSPFPQVTHVTVTTHPAAILRAPDSTARAEARSRFVEDLRAIKKLLAKASH
ncbi:MAG: UdgX family uracil-DNA binding protein [Vicinamibacterales bacterium]